MAISIFEKADYRVHLKNGITFTREGISMMELSRDLKSVLIDDIINIEKYHKGYFNRMKGLMLRK
jgi:hypothetical protein